MVFADHELLHLVEVCGLPTIRIDDTGAPGDPYEEFLVGGFPERCKVPVADEEQMISINYPSGTTGRPKVSCRPTEAPRRCPVHEGALRAALRTVRYNRARACSGTSSNVRLKSVPHDFGRSTPGAPHTELADLHALELGVQLGSIRSVLAQM